MNKNFKSRKYWIIPLFIALVSALIISAVAGDFLFGLFSGFLSSLTSIIIALFIIFALKHLMDAIEQKVLKNYFNNTKNPFAIKRAISIIIAFILLVLVVFIVINMIVPRVIEIGTELFTNKDQYIYQIKTQLTEFVNKIIPNGGDTISSLIDGFVANLGDTLTNILPKVIAFGTSTFAFIGQCLLGVLMAFLYLKDKEKIRDYSKKVIQVNCPNKAPQLFSITQKSDKILLDYMVAKILEAGVLTIGIGITLALLGVRYAFELAFIISILNVIPYIGFIISLIPTILITLIYGSVDQAITVLIVLVVVYTFLTTFVTPYIIGKKIKTNMLLMIVSMVIGGGMFGMLGMAFAPPVAAIMSVIFNDIISRKEAEQKPDENVDRSTSPPMMQIEYNSEFTQNTKDKINSTTLTDKNKTTDISNEIIENLVNTDNKVDSDN